MTRTPYWMVLVAAAAFAWPPLAGIIAAIWLLLWIGTWVLRALNAATDDVHRNTRR
jgi:hypothetical protein